MISTKYYRSPFLFKTIPGELFYETKKRNLDFIGYGEMMDITKDGFTFNLKLLDKFDIPNKFPLLFI